MSWAKTTELRIDPTTSSRAHIIFRDIVPSLLSVTSGSSRLAGERAYCETPKNSWILLGAIFPAKHKMTLSGRHRPRPVGLEARSHLALDCLRSAGLKAATSGWVQTLCARCPTQQVIH